MAQERDMLERRLARIELDLSTVLTMLQLQQLRSIQMANDLGTLKDKLTNLTGVDQSVIALLNGLSAQIKALQPNQDAIDALAAQIDQETAALTAAVTANTTAAPGPATPPSQPTG